MLSKQRSVKRVNYSIIYKLLVHCNSLIQATLQYNTYNKFLAGLLVIDATFTTFGFNDVGPISRLPLTDGLPGMDVYFIHI